MLIGDRYEVISTLEGGMGLAYVCKDLAEKGRSVVLKTFKGGDSSQEFRSALIREASAWIELQGQQYLARIDDLRIMDGQLYIKMPFYPNGSLADILQKGPLAVSDAVKFAAQILLGMRYLSGRAGFLHLDLKPQNILIGEHNEALITDLGLAKPFLRLDGSSYKICEESKEKSGISGTLPYMPPEVFKGARATPAADVWAWGLIFYEMLTGRQAFFAPTLEGLIKQIVTTPPIGWQEFSQKFPKSIVSIISSCIEKEPSRRFSSFRLVSEAFDKAIKAGIDDDKGVFWKRDDRVSLDDKTTAIHWVAEMRKPKDATVFSIKYTELTNLVRAKQYYSIGDKNNALNRIKDILGNDQEWAENWVKLMASRSAGVIHTEGNGNTLSVLPGRQSLLEIAEIRMILFLDRLYAYEQVSQSEVESYCHAAICIMNSGEQSAKLAELCGQLFLKMEMFDFAERCFNESWRSGSWVVQVSTAACLATLYGTRGDVQKLRDFASTEIEPRFADLEDARAQEACARPYLFLREPERALHFLERSLAIEPNNPWGTTQACIAAWNCRKVEEAKIWRRKLSLIAPNSQFTQQLDRSIPALSP